jgi:hypothetical protein
MDGVHGFGVRFGLKAETAEGNCLDSSQMYNEWTGIEVRSTQNGCIFNVDIVFSSRGGIALVVC